MNSFYRIFSLFFLLILGNSLLAKEIYLTPNQNSQEEVQEALILLEPGDILTLSEGVFDFKDSAGKKLSISFHDFLLIIQSQGRDQRDQHWRNQSDFLHYEKYDDYFSLELFSSAINSLDAQGFIVHDTRGTLNHDLSNFNITYNYNAKT